MKRLESITLGLLLAAALTGAAAAGEFTHEVVSGAPEGLPEATAELVTADGIEVKDPDGKVVARYWGREAAFEGEPAEGFGIRFDSIPEGALIAVVEFPDKGSDFREQTISPGLYTLRYALHPEDGNHMGVAPSRDFAVLTPADKDPEPAKNYDFDGLVELTALAGNPHPTIARIELPEGDESPNLWENDYELWVLDLASAGDTVGIVVWGHSEE